MALPAQTFTTLHRFDNTPAVANGVVCVGSFDNNLYAFGLTGSAVPALPERPDLETLSPNLSLPVSRPAAKLPDSDD